jgi:ketosteroid isomerase-like protein
MTRISLMLAFAVMVMGCSHGEGDRTPPSAQVAEQELRQAVHDIDRMAVEGDPEFFEGALTDDFFFTGPKGETLNKQQLVGSFERGTVDYTFFETDQVDVRVYGQTAVVLGRLRAEEVGQDGESLAWTRRITTTWVWRDGRWRAAAWHASTLVEEPQSERGV